MTKNVKRKLSLKKVTVASMANPYWGIWVTDGEVLLATVPTSPPITVSSTVPFCRFHTLK